MRTRVAGENQDKSKRPLKRYRTRRGTLRRPSINQSSKIPFTIVVNILQLAFEEDSSLLEAYQRRAKRDRGAWPTKRDRARILRHDSVTTQAAIQDNNVQDNDYERQAKDIRVIYEGRVRLVGEEHGIRSRTILAPSQTVSI